MSPHHHQVTFSIFIQPNINAAVTHTTHVKKKLKRNNSTQQWVFNGAYPPPQTFLFGRRRRGNSSPGKCSGPVATPRSADRLPFITIVYLYISNIQYLCICIFRFLCICSSPMASPRSADRLPFIGPDGCRIIASHARANSSGIQTTNNPHLEIKHEML